MKHKAFTLAELVITLSIIGVAAALVAPAVSNIVPDKNKVKVLNYYSMLGNAITDIFNDDDLYHPYTTFNPVSGTLVSSCSGISCISNFDSEIQSRVGNLDNSTWRIVSNASGYTVTIDVDSSKDGCGVYSANCPIKKADTFIFSIDANGGLSPVDPLSKAYLKNPLNVNDRKADEKIAKTFLKES